MPEEEKTFSQRLILIKETDFITHTRFNEVLHHMDGEGLHWQQVVPVAGNATSELNLRDGLSSNSHSAVSVQFQLSHGSVLQFCLEEISTSELYEVLKRINITLIL